MAVAVLAVTRPAAQDPRREVHDYLARTGFTAEEIAGLEGGQVLARATSAKAAAEIAVVAAVKIAVPRDRAIAYYGQMISYVDGRVTLGFGRFSEPATLDDVKAMSLERSEVDELKSCRPGRCDLRLGGAGIETLRSSIDWGAADYVDRVNGFVRKSAVGYVEAYRARGDAALVTYDDRDRAVNLREQWQGILAGSPHFHDYAPELKQYLERYPSGTLTGARDVLYWTRESFGLKPIISIVHGIVYEPPSRSDRAFVVQKQIYASHYYDGSLAVATLLSATDGTPATYLVYANRSRGDLLRGGFGGLKRNMAESQARKAALDTLGAIKRALETAGS